MAREITVSGLAKMHPRLSAYEVAAQYLDGAPAEIADEVRRDLLRLQIGHGASAGRSAREGLAGLNRRFATFESWDNVPGEEDLWRTARKWAAVSPDTMPRFLHDIAQIDGVDNDDDLISGRALCAVVDAQGTYLSQIAAG